VLTLVAQLPRKATGKVLKQQLKVDYGIAGL
jgi:hypothetical protein